jgi:hypothetical protein
MRRLPDQRLVLLKVPLLALLSSIDALSYEPRHAIKPRSSRKAG